MHQVIHTCIRKCPPTICIIVPIYSTTKFNLFIKVQQAQIVFNQIINTIPIMPWKNVLHLFYLDG